MGNCWGLFHNNQVINTQNSPSATTTTSSNPEPTTNENITGIAAVGNGKSPARGGGGGDDASAPPPPLKIYTLAELKTATRNFRPDTVLGEGGFGRVFKGWVDDKTYAPSKVGVGMPVAVKKSNPDSSQGLREWRSEVKFLSKFSHPNLVKLIGYCWEETQFLLVYEYMQKGSLENHLFRRGSAESLSWDIRLKIVIGAARGLEFLHTYEKSVIYRDFKSSNILLDADFNAKLSDFGLAKLGPANGNSHVTTRIMGTYGYAAPEYVATGHLYVRSDVYGFGVVLLEMLTGLQALDTKRPTGEQNLVEWARSSLSDKKRLKKIMEPGLENQCTMKAALKTAELILKCLEGDPKNRPPMDEVLATLEEINSMSKPKQNKPNSTPEHPTRRRNESSLSSSHTYHNHHRSPLHHNHHHHHVHHGVRSH